MHRRPLRTASDVCWKCRCRLEAQRPFLSGRDAGGKPLPRRTLHATASRSQIARAEPSSTVSFDPSLHGAFDRKVPIRQHLTAWQNQFGGPNEETLKAFENHPDVGGMRNDLSTLSSSAKADEGFQEGGADLHMENDDEELITVGLFLKPGDIVEIGQSGREHVLAVFVQQLDFTSQFFSINGRWCHASLSNISFAIPGVIDPSLLQTIIPFLPTRPGEIDPKHAIQVPRHLGAPIEAILERLSGEAEQIYRANAPVLDSAYSVLADATRARMMTLTQIAKNLLKQNTSPSPAALLAVRKSLLQNEFRFRSDSHNQRLTNIFTIRPKNDVQLVETVHEWIREYQEHEALSANASKSSGAKRTDGVEFVLHFLEKARRLVANSRQTRDPDPGFIGPSKTRFAAKNDSPTIRVTWGEEFSSTDKQIIKFLQAWVLMGQFSHMPSLHSACTFIIHATGCYDAINTEMNSETGHLFLQEIGVLTPYENRHLYDEQLMLPTVRLSRNVELLNTKVELTRRNPDFRDSMAELRRDWGSLPVYCIDPQGAQEIDDGISITQVDGSKSEFWIHVHVANPTAFFDPTHVISGLAAHMTSTVYTPERTFPMLPQWASENYFSLGRNRPVITFSSKVNLSGKVLETKIQSGIIRNVQQITPHQVSAALGETPEAKIHTFVVGGAALPKVHQAPKLSNDQHRDLRNLYSMTKALWQARRAAGGIGFGFQKPQVQVYENSQRPGLTWSPPSLEKARLVHGDPIIKVESTQVESSLRQEARATDMVEEMMLLACQTAASWCAERNIPVMYRGTIQTPTTESLSLEQFKTDVLFPHMEQHGTVSAAVGYRYIEHLGRAIAHSSPIPHSIIGASSYLKVTSPLRRFSDMIAHWQIEAALRYEAQNDKKFDASAASLPFSQRQLQESIITLTPREKIIKQTSAKSSHFWVMQAFMRAFYYKEAPIPDVFKVWVRYTDSPLGAIGYMSDFAVKVVIKNLPDVEYEMGDEWEVKIDSINAFSGFMFMTPVRLMNRGI